MQDCKHEFTIFLHIMRTKQIYSLPADFLPFGLIRSEQKEARISLPNKQFLAYILLIYLLVLLIIILLKNTHIGGHDK